MTEITNLISAVGFPIVAFLLMYQMCNTTIQKVTDSINELKIAITELKVGEKHDS